MKPRHNGDRGRRALLAVHSFARSLVGGTGSRKRACEWRRGRHLNAHASVICHAHAEEAKEKAPFDTFVSRRVAARMKKKKTGSVAPPSNFLGSRKQATLYRQLVDVKALIRETLSRRRVSSARTARRVIFRI